MPPDADALATLVVHTIQKTLTPVLERLAAAEARLAVLPDTHTAVTELRERVVVVETKAAQPASVPALPPPVDLTPVLERIGALSDRVVTVETKAAMPLPVLEQTEKPVDLAPVLERLAALTERIGTVEMKTAVTEARAASVAELTKDVGSLRERVAVVETRPPVPGPKGDPGKDGEPGKDGTPGLSFEGVYQEGQTYEKGNLVTWAGSSWHCNTTTTAKPGEGSKDWQLMVKRGRDGRDGVNGKDAAMPVVKVTGKFTE